MIAAVYKKRGISLLEVVIGISIIAIVALIVTGGFFRFKKGADINAAVEVGASFLFDARAKTLSSQGASRYGVHFENNRITLFKGVSFSSGSPDNVETLLPQNVEIFNIALRGGDKDVIFKRLSGATDQDGTLTFRLRSDISSTKTITILQTGTINIQ